MTPQTEQGLDDDIFGPSRSEPAAPTRPKVSMISARIRTNEERKRVIELSSQKLEKIDDPAKDLRRSVCINNTYCRLSDDARREKEVRRKRARDECAGMELTCEESVSAQRRRRAVEDECLALLDAIPELSDATLGCAAMARGVAAPPPPPPPPTLDT